MGGGGSWMVGVVASSEVLFGLFCFSAVFSILIRSYYCRYLFFLAAYNAEEDVDAEDEGFGDQQSFPKVKGAPHLGHEFAVDHCAAVGEDGLHEA